MIQNHIWRNLQGICSYSSSHSPAGAWSIVWDLGESCWGTGTLVLEMWDDMLRMEGSRSTGWQYHLCILHGWTIQYYIEHQWSTIVSLQDRVGGCDAIDKNGLVMMVLWIRLKKASSSADQTFSAMFWSSSCRAQLRKTPPQTPGGSIKWLVSTQLSPCPPPLPPTSRCVCPASSSLWSSVTERVPATSTSNHILSVTHRQEVLLGKKKVRQSTEKGFGSNSGNAEKNTLHINTYQHLACWAAHWVGSE